MSTVMPTQAMVLAAGLGKRMRPLTDHIPKPMIEVAGCTMVDRAIDYLEGAGVTRVVVNGSYKADLLEAHLKKRISPQLMFSREAEPLETGGGIAYALHYFSAAPFFAVNGDIIWTDGSAPALRRLASAWDDRLDALLLVHPVEKAIGYGGQGDFFLSPEGHLTRRAGSARAPYVYAGVQLLHPRLFKGAPRGAFSLNVLYDKAIETNPPRIKAIVHDGAWLHVGDPQGKEQAEEYLRTNGC